MERIPEPEYMDDSAEAEAYARTDFSDVNRAFVERLLELLGPAERVRAVDLGAGPGDIPIRVVRARPSWHVTGVDASAAMLEFGRPAAAAAGVSQSVEFVLADAKHLPFPAGAFDVVFSNSILHHVTDTDSLWREVRRIGRSGAWVFLRDLARPPDSETARRLVEQYAGNETHLLKEEFYRSFLSAYTPDEVRAQLGRVGLAGFKVRMVTDRHLDVTGRLP